MLTFWSKTQKDNMIFFYNELPVFLNVIEEKDKDMKSHVVSSLPNITFLSS